ncbi:type I polyketide synthase [Dactylosporangium siamense]|uniref:type I polyketide synthase n=2 Tax=Dactylosporangium siamense TaxID=685454 RepID=UPI003608B716
MAHERSLDGQTSEARAGLLARLRAAGEADRDRMLLDVVRAAVVAATGKPGPVEGGLAFRQLGVYRAIGTSLREELATATGVRIPATLLFDYPTPVAVAGFLRDELLGERTGGAASVTHAAVASEDPVVIVGMSCRYAGGVDTPEALWRLVADGSDAVTTFPTDRGWRTDLYDPDPDAVGRCCTRHGSFLHDAAQFDAAFFGISPREALGMDPQQRLLLEVAWEALESARIDPLSVAGRPGGVYVGVPYTHYGPALHRPADGMHGYLLTGSLTSVASGRVAYTLGLEGQAVTVDTACSSSLVALHLATRALRGGECELALVGGVTVMSTPGVLMEFSRKRGLSLDGRCKAFSDDADGTGWGEGAGMLVLERLSTARARGHRVLAVVRGSALNQDGASNGLTAPNGPSQQRVIRAALADAGLQAGEVDAVEAHGTGTALGDPIEAQAILATYGRDRDGAPLWLGSLKSNVGHTQAAAGVGGIIKMVLAMHHGVLPQTLHVSAPSTHVDWAGGNVSLLREAVAWPETGRPRRAAVSSFGVSGTNAHVILEAPAPQDTDQPAAATELVPVPIVVSGRGEAALRAQAARLAGFLDAQDLAGVGWSLVSTRAALPHRAVVVGADHDAVRAQLRRIADGSTAGVLARPGGKVAFVFPGQGSQWAGMAVRLLDTDAGFAASIARCEAAFAPYVDWSLTAVLRGEPGAAPLSRVDVVQPVLFAVMVSLAGMWRAAGVAPDVVVGHSQGEIAAAHVAGILSLDDAARVVVLRSQALSALTGKGGMLSVALPAGDVAARIADWAGRLGVAAVNGTTSAVVSGEPAALDEFTAVCAAAGVRTKRIDVDYASHGVHVEAIRDRLLDVLAPVAPLAATVPMHSTVGADLAGVTVGGADYWYRNLRHSVEFAAAVRALTDAGVTTFIEVSAHPVLTVGIQETLDTHAGDAFVTGTLRRDDGGRDRFLTSLGAAYAHGAAVDWTGVFGPDRQTVALPTYAFQRQRFWLESPLLEDPATTATGPSVDGEFWAAVEQADAAGLAGVLSADTDAVAAVLPALRTWHEHRAVRGLVDGWRYKVRWDALPEPSAVTLTGEWLIVHPDPETVPGPIVAALIRHGATVRVLAVDPSSTDRPALSDLLRDALSGDVPVVGVLSLLAADERLRDAVPAGATGNLLLVQALADLGVAAPLWCVTRGAVAVDGERLAAPAQAQTWGLGRVAALEHPRTWGGLIDLPPGDGADLDARVAARLCATLAGLGVPDRPAGAADSASGPGGPGGAGSSGGPGGPAGSAGLGGLVGLGGEDQVAVRATAVFGRRLVPARTGSAAATRTWRPSGTVLVTGGTGALGVHVARWLAAAGARRLVLTSRRGAAAPGVADLVAELAVAGTEASVVACDVADRDAVAALVADCAGRGEPITAVMHTAGVADLAALPDLTVDGMAAVVGGKVGGALHLAELLNRATLDAVVYFSSIAAVWGVGDHGAYAAANAHLDALAEQQRADGVPAHSVAWGPWAGGGMIADSLADTLRRRGVPLIDPDPAMHALQQVLDHDDTTVAVADVDWERFAAVFGSARRSPLISALPQTRPALEAAPGPDAAGAAGGGGLARDLAGLGTADRDRVLLDLVRGQVARVLGHASTATVESSRAFMELGFDSLSAVELRNGLSAATGLRLPATAVFDHPTPAHLARFLRAELFGEAREAPAAAPVAAVDRGDPIVIVGIGCRYPGGVRSPEDLWRLVEDEVDAVGAMPADRGWDLAGLYDPDPDRSGTTYVRHGGFLYDAADFDPEAFGISPREAVAMDPQQRLLLEVAWDAAEHARIAPTSLRNSRTGVFVGMADQAYGSRPQSGAEGIEGYLVTGGASSVASGRISYVLGLEGPAVTVDTACSSSLVALHLAVESLRRGECDLALAGAAMVMSTPSQFVGFSRQRGLSRDGRCKAFGAGADGFGLAEGAGMVLLERLSDARANGHRVLAVVRGTAVNQDGASNGLTAPNGPSQQRVIRTALAAAGLAPSEVDAVEGHGTGTLLGDPIEAQAVLATYGQDREIPLWLGSLKSNIGHTQTAAGIGGVIKMVLAMEHGTLPRTLHADEPSPHIDWSSGAVRLLTRAQPWPAGERPRRAGVSSFGISGTNAHVIIEEPPAAIPAATPDAELHSAPTAAGGPVPLVLSAYGARALAAQATLVRERIGAAGARADDATANDVDVADVAWSLLTTRAALPERAVVLGRDRAELADGLAALASGAEPTTGPAVVRGTGDVDGRVVFVFPGQGAQWAGMAAELLETTPVFAASVLACEEALTPFVDWSLRAVLRGDDGAPGLDRVDVVQPASWAVMVSLAALWRSHGVQPDAVVGHSQGEIAAACVAGMLSLGDAARVVAERSKAIVALAGGGAMASVALPVAAARDRIAAAPADSGRISVAVVNAPTAVVVAGDVAAVHRFVADCTADGVRARLVDVDYASHSEQVESIEGALLAALAPVRGVAGTVPMLSTATGEWLAGPQLDAGYWFRNLRETVRFSDGVQRLVEDGYRAFVECSPHPVLTVPIQETADASTDGAYVVVGSLRRGDGGPDRFARSVAELHVRGGAVDFTPLLGTGRTVVDLPTYAYQRRRFWLDGAPAAAGGAPADDRFWDAVRRGDVSGLAGATSADPAALAAVLPALRTWHEGSRVRAAVDELRYAVRWDALDEPGAALSGRWLVVAFGSTGGTVDGPVDVVLAALAAHGADADLLRIPAGEADRDRIAELLRPLVAGPVDGVLSLLAWDEAPHRTVPELPAGLAGNVGLLQALNGAGVGAKLWCATGGAVSVGAGDALHRPVQAQVWGMGIVAGLDDPDGWGGLVDLPATVDAAAAARLCAVLAGIGDEDQVAIRPEGVFGRRLVRAPLPAGLGAAGGPDRPWRPHGTVLVTGGTGSLGGHVARWLAGAGATRLVLTSRRGMAAPGVAELVAELAALGAEATVVACDVGDREQVRRLLADLPAGSPLTAVVHAAGVPGHERPLSGTDLADMAAVLRGKAAGAMHLDALLAAVPLDAFVMFSSGAGVWGNLGQAAYAAGNAYLEALARHRRDRGQAATCVAWGAWEVGGMVDAGEADRLAEHGILGMDPAHAVAALRDAVEHGEAALVVARVDWARFGALYSMARHRPLLDELPEARPVAGAGAEEEPGAGHPEPAQRLRGLADDERQRELVHLVRSHAAGTLGHATPEAVTASRPFRELGFDSLTAVDLRNKLTALTGLRLPVTVVFDHPTPAALARHLNTALVPDVAGDPLAALDALAAALPAGDADPGTRRQVAERLRSLLRRWDDGPVEGGDGLAEADDDEMFDLIDRELGLT